MIIAGVLTAPLRYLVGVDAKLLMRPRPTASAIGDGPMIRAQGGRRRAAKRGR